METEDLLQALVERFGEEPAFSVARNDYPPPGEGYGFSVSYKKGSVTMREVRDAVDELTPWDHPAMLSEREPYRGPFD